MHLAGLGREREDRVGLHWCPSLEGVRVYSRFVALEIDVRSEELEHLGAGQLLGIEAATEVLQNTVSLCRASVVEIANPHVSERRRWTQRKARQRLGLGGSRHNLPARSSGW